MVTEQLRLLWAVILIGSPLVAGYRFSRRFSPPLPAATDALLIAFLIQYLAVGFTGLVGILSGPAVTVFTLIVSLAVALAARGTPLISPRAPRRESRWALFILAAGFAFCAAVLLAQSLQPPLATDSLTYHLPAAVEWLQEHRLSLFQTWFFNPANTFSPLAGSLFQAFLIAPLHNDALARFAQIAPWAMVFLIAAQLGSDRRCAAVAALALVLSRPFISESILAKDDLFVAAFFLAAVAELSPGRISTSLSPFRLGIAIGLLLATKFTALLTLPILLLVADAPVRAGWRGRQWIIAIGLPLLIAGPWYLRNLLRWHNPFYPIRIDLLGLHLPGLLPPLHSQTTRSLAGLLEVLAGGYYSMPAILLAGLGVTWAAALFASRRRVLREPFQRLLLLGPVVGVTLFAFFTPQPEVRFLLPAFSLLFITANRFRAAAAVVLVLSLATCFSKENAGQTAVFACGALAIALAAILLDWLQTDVLRFGRPTVWIACVAVALLVLIFRWPHYLGEYKAARFQFWSATYPDQSPAWQFVDEHVPAGATIAYSNEFMIYPLYGFDISRRLVYAPIRKRASIAELRFDGDVSAENLFQKAGEAANANPDPLAWRQNLAATAAGYLFLGPHAPERAWANADAAHFQKLFEDANALVFRIRGLN